MNVKEEKRRLRAKRRRDKGPEREQRRKERECFWTWRWGHIYTAAEGDSVRCEICDHSVFVGYI